ncbi:hypothetical protein [Aquamicrobium soli]|uniref:Suppressor of fused-like domain-containing protein n=1 Tax=Aquamicrobium soli TaxID=1811518 RepID=A0ABV7KCY5_9HYPH
MGRDDEILSDLETIANSPKNPVGLGEWIIEHKGNAELISLSMPLAIDGAQLGGARILLRGPRSTPASRPFYGLVALLFATIGGVTFHLGRIEFDPENPLKPHRNPLNPHSAPPVVQGRQIHRFYANRFLGLDAFRPEGRLPLAFPIEQEFVRFDDVMAFVRDEFVIPDFWVEEPVWSRQLV